MVVKIKKSASNRMSKGEDDDGGKKLFSNFYYLGGEVEKNRFFPRVFVSLLFPLVSSVRAWRPGVVHNNNKYY